MKKELQRKSKQTNKNLNDGMSVSRRRLRTVVASLRGSPGVLQGCYSLKFVRTVLFVKFAYAKIYVRKAIHETFLRTKNRKSVCKHTNGLSCRTTEIFLLSCVWLQDLKPTTNGPPITRTVARFVQAPAQDPLVCSSTRQCWLQLWVSCTVVPSALL